LNAPWNVRVKTERTIISMATRQRTILCKYRISVLTD
jgi:hypothetical protein